MSHLNIKATLLIIPFVLLLISSCTKQVPGPKGDPGEPAKKGNVRQSQRSITIPAASWSFDGSWWIATTNVPEITSVAENSGEVKVYMKVGTEWWSLPYAVGDIIMEMTFESGLLHFKYAKIHNGPPPSPGLRNFRIVVLAPVR